MFKQFLKMNEDLIEASYAPGRDITIDVSALFCFYFQTVDPTNFVSQSKMVSRSEGNLLYKHIYKPFSLIDKPLSGHFIFK